MVEGKVQAKTLDACLANYSDDTLINEKREDWLKDQDDPLRLFQYTSVLTHSAHQHDRQEAFVHLEHLISDPNCQEYFRDSLFLSAIARYLAHEYDAARSLAEELLRLDPDNPQVKNLYGAIKYKHQEQNKKRKKKDEIIATSVGIGILGVVAIGVTSLLLSKRK